MFYVTFDILINFYPFHQQSTKIHFSSEFITKGNEYYMNQTMQECGKKSFEKRRGLLVIMPCSQILIKRTEPILCYTYVHAMVFANIMAMSHPPKLLSSIRTKKRNAMANVKKTCREALNTFHVRKLDTMYICKLCEKSCARVCTWPVCTAHF